MPRPPLNSPPLTFQSPPSSQSATRSHAARCAGVTVSVDAVMVEAAAAGTAAGTTTAFGGATTVAAAALGAAAASAASAVKAAVG